MLFVDVILVLPEVSKHFVSISEDFNNSYEEDIKIEKIAFHYFYNPSKWAKEENTMASNLCERIVDQAPFNSIIERGIVTSFSFFLDTEFLVSNNDQFPNQPGIPANWRNNIEVISYGSTANYFLRKRNQSYLLTVSYVSIPRIVIVNVTHLTVNHRPYTVHYREADLLGLSDAVHCISYALHFVEICVNEFENLVYKAVEDKPPTAQRTPLG